MTEVTTTKGGMFKALYGKGQDVIDTIQMPFVRAALKRNYHAAHDSATKQIADFEKSLAEERQKLGDLNINTILDLKDSINRAKEVQTSIVDEYKVMFGSDMKVTTIDDDEE